MLLKPKEVDFARSISIRRRECARGKRSLSLSWSAPRTIEVVKQYIYQFRPWSYSGSQSAEWEANAKLLGAFENHADAELVEFARNEREKLRATLEELRQEEMKSERPDNERFE